MFNFFTVSEHSAFASYNSQMRWCVKASGLLSTTVLFKTTGFGACNTNSLLLKFSLNAVRFKNKYLMFPF